MIKCMHYWSTPRGLENAEPIDDAIEAAVTHGFDGIELGIAPQGELSIDATQQQCESIRERLDAAGLVCETLASGMTWAMSPTSDDADTRAKSIDAHTKALQRAAWLGCEALLFVPGIVTSPIAPDERVPYETAVDRTRQATEQLAKVAESVGIDLCLENVWNGLLLTPIEWREFIDGIGSPRVGMYFDCGNLLGYHQHPPHWVDTLGQRIKRVHIKDFKLDFDWQGSFSFCRLSEGDVPLAETLTALRAIGYDRTIVAEMLPFSDGLLEHTSRRMDDLLNPNNQGAA